MADYTITYADPKTGKAITGTIQRVPNETEMAALKQQYGPSVTVTPKAPEKPKEKPVLSKGSMKFPINAEAAGYAALGAIPEAGPAALATRAGLPAAAKFLATHPKVIGTALRSLGAGGIGAGTAKDGQDPMREGLKSGATQLGLEAILAPVVHGLPRVGGGRLKELEDSVASEIMTRARAIVPWWKGLKDSHQGLRELAEYGEGQALLSKHYGSALADVKALVSPEEKMVLSLEDAKALKIPDASMEPIMPDKFTATDFKRGGKLALEPTQVSVPTHLVIDNVQGVSGRDAALSQRTVDAIDQTLPEVGSDMFKESRRLYREGKSIINGLKDMNVIDENTKRLNLERLSKGSATLDEQGKSVWERSIRGPESKQMFQDTIPKGKAPKAIGMPGKAYVAPGHVGVAGHGTEPSNVASVLRATQPNSILYSENVPTTSTEDAVRRWLPGAIHGILTPSPQPKEGVSK